MKVYLNKDPCCHKWGCKCRIINGECKVCIAKDKMLIPKVENKKEKFERMNPDFWD